MSKFPRKHLWLILLLAFMAIPVSVSWGWETVDFSQVTEIDDLAYEVDSGELFTGTAIKYYPDGSKEYTADFLNGKLQGKFILWYENGIKKGELEFSGGTQVGEEIIYSENGEKSLGSEYEDGNLVRWWMYHPNGRKRIDIECTNGSITGRGIGYYPSGKKWFDLEYKNGKQHGKWIEWYESGPKKSEIECQEGKVLSRICWDEYGNRIDCEFLQHPYPYEWLPPISKPDPTLNQR